MKVFGVCALLSLLVLSEASGGITPGFPCSHKNTYIRGYTSGTYAFKNFKSAAEACEAKGPNSCYGITYEPKGKLTGGKYTLRKGNKNSNGKRMIELTKEPTNGWEVSYTKGGCSYSLLSSSKKKKLMIQDIKNDTKYKLVSTKLTVEDQIVAYGLFKKRTGVYADKFFINLMADDDVLMRVAFRMDQKVIVLNNLIGNKWQEEVRPKIKKGASTEGFDFDKFEDGKWFKVRIVVGQYAYKIFFTPESGSEIEITKPYQSKIYTFPTVRTGKDVSMVTHISTKSTAQADWKYLQIPGGDTSLSTIPASLLDLMGCPA